jgi:transketolase
MSTLNEAAAAQVSVNTIRFLSVDMVEEAGCGHPGAPMAQAPIAYQLWAHHLRFDPGQPDWPNRDRFVLSCGHASALLYSLLHLAGYDLGLDEIRNFRQLGSKTPGHPEHGLTPGVETTTGPLGQGLGNAVGMALAERMLGAHFNRPGQEIFDHRTWVMASDGDLMEGVASEACSWAGNLGLGKLNVIYDDNRITIDGTTDITFTEDVRARFDAYGWHTEVVEDGNDLDSLDAAFRSALAETDRPSLLLVRTHIGFGSPNKHDSPAAHGAALGADEVRLTKQALGWPLEPTFRVPDEARLPFAAAARRGGELHAAWRDALEQYRTEHPELAGELDRRLDGRLPDGWASALPSYGEGDGAVATRKVSGATLNAVASTLPELIGGSADLSGSNNTDIDGEEDQAAALPGGRNLRFGVREHGMGAALNGMALSGLVRPYGGTFLIFSDYMRAAVRLAAMMELPVLYVFTHDSIFLGEDGPTHQPVSQLASLRAIPNLTVIRPADANETVAAWRVALENTAGPTALVLTRQKLPILAQTTGGAAYAGVERGGYVIADTDGTPDLVLLATGSEVALALAARDLLGAEGVAARVVSLPSWERFAAQPSDYRDSVLPPEVTARLSIEAGASFGWDRWIGSGGASVAQDGFGASAPASDLATHFGFTAEGVAAKARQLLATS